MMIQSYFLSRSHAGLYACLLVGMFGCGLQTNEAIALGAIAASVDTVVNGASLMAYKYNHRFVSEPKFRVLLPGKPVNYQLLSREAYNTIFSRVVYRPGVFVNAVFDSADAKHAYFSGRKVALDSIVNLRFRTQTDVRMSRALVYSGCAIMLFSVRDVGASASLFESAELGIGGAIVGIPLIIAGVASGKSNYSVNKRWRFAAVPTPVAGPPKATKL